MKGYRKILIAVNGSASVVKQGLKLAQDEKCWVTVLKVIPPYEGDLNLTSIKNIQDVLDSGVKKISAEIKDIAATEKALIKLRVEEGDIEKKIVETAEEERCDIIVMTSHKQNWFQRLLFGDVVENIINTAPCPVLVVCINIPVYRHNTPCFPRPVFIFFMKVII